MVRVDKSVAVYASERMGKVASEAKDPWETCLKPGGIPPNSTGKGCNVCCAVRCDCERGWETTEAEIWTSGTKAALLQHCNAPGRPCDCDASHSRKPQSYVDNSLIFMA